MESRIEMLTVGTRRLICKPQMRFRPIKTTQDSFSVFMWTNLSVCSEFIHISWGTTWIFHLRRRFFNFGFRCVRRRWGSSGDRFRECSYNLLCWKKRLFVIIQMDFLSNLVQVFPSLKTRPFYLSGESYADMGILLTKAPIWIIHLCRGIYSVHHQGLSGHV